MNPLKAFIATLGTRPKTKKIKANSLYDIKINCLSGDPINLADYKGKYMLFVNVASKCGFTPQYKDLQVLYDAYHEKLQVIGVPCNQFGGQEPDDANTIKTFCQANYGVSFLMTEKIDVDGKNQHNLYAWLTQKVNNGVMDSSVKWNFQKYLVDPKGKLIDYFISTTSPTSKKITNHLK